jgi:hypothetical protein
MIAAWCAIGALVCWLAPSYLGADPTWAAIWRLGAEVLTLAAVVIVVTSALAGRLGWRR